LSIGLEGGAVYEFKTLDSGERQQFATGARRDTDKGKPRFELLPIMVLIRDALLYGRGAEKYDDDNWRQGMPFRRVFGSLLRHAYQWAMGDRTEDHMAAVRFNAAALMTYEDEILAGKLPASLADMPGWTLQPQAAPPAPAQVLATVRYGDRVYEVVGPIEEGQPVVFTKDGKVRAADPGGEGQQRVASPATPKPEDDPRWCDDCGGPCELDDPIRKGE
jgi:hypothetical protein